jgi:soluble lytic murein transglycosylase
MKYFILIILNISICINAYAVDIDRIINIESSGNSKAYNSRSGAIGLMQITAICLEEYNNYNKVKYSRNDLFNPDINIKIGTWYLNERIPAMLKYYKMEVSTANILISYNAGISYVISGKALPDETVNYIKKYNKMEVSK